MDRKSKDAEHRQYLLRRCAPFHDSKGIHRKVALNILSYFNETRKFDVKCQKRSDLSVSVFVDVDYVSKTTDKRSVPAGGALMVGSAAVAWMPRTQRCVTLSGTEVVYVYMGDCVKEVRL